MFNSLCLSHLSYAISVWGSSSSSTLNRLVTLQKKGIRHVCNSKYNAHTDPLYFDNNILSLKDLFNLSIVKLVFKKRQSKLPLYHSKKLPIKSEILEIETRQKHDIIMDTCKPKISKMNSINFKTGTAWNTLPFEIKNGHYKTIKTFSKHVRKYYISKYDKTCQVRNCYICNKC